MEVLNNVIDAYNAVKFNGVSQGMIWLCTFIAVIIVINKFITAFKKATGDERDITNIKHFFELFYIYIAGLAVLMIAPFAFTLVERCLGEVQNDLIAYYQRDIDLSIDEAIKTFTIDYLEDTQRQSNWFGQQIQEIIVLPWCIFTYTVLLYATKYIFFFFASARYLYLIFLEIAMPLAVIFYMDEKLRHYTYTYLKNLGVCYMLLPAFLVANAFGSLISDNVMHMIYANKYTMLGLFLSLIFKIFLFGKAVKYCNQIF